MSKGRDQNIYCLGQMQFFLGKGDFLHYLHELEENQQLISEFEDKTQHVDGFTKKFNSVFDFRLYRTLLYSLVRVTKPRSIFETGVLHGMTSAFLLEALNKNGRGKLVSIDFPSYFGEVPANKDGIMDTLPSQKEPGWIVPDRLNSNWELNLGSSNELLPSLLSQLDQPLDFFIHDSDHTYRNMQNELNVAWEFLATGGVLVCDNIDMNTSFFDFCREKNSFPILFPVPNDEMASHQRFGILIKK